MNDRVEAVRREIKRLHDESPNECMRVWWYEGHVEAVARYARDIAARVGADAEIAVLAALCHDIARAWDVTSEPGLMDESLAKTAELMTDAGYDEDAIARVREAIRTHSCRDAMPATEEGRVMSTADALAHFFSDLYFVLPFYGWLTAAKDYEGYRRWILGRIERDMTRKIHYPEYLELARPKYEALKTIFSLPA